MTVRRCKSVAARKRPFGGAERPVCRTCRVRLSAYRTGDTRVDGRVGDTRVDG